MARQCLKLGRIDEVPRHLVPALFGSGTPVSGGLDNGHIPLEPVEVIATADLPRARSRRAPFGQPLGQPAAC